MFLPLAPISGFDLVNAVPGLLLVDANVSTAATNTIVHLKILLVEVYNVHTRLCTRLTSEHMIRSS